MVPQRQPRFAGDGEEEEKDGEAASNSGAMKARNTATATATAAKETLRKVIVTPAKVAKACRRLQARNGAVVQPSEMMCRILNLAWNWNGPAASSSSRRPCTCACVNRRRGARGGADFDADDASKPRKRRKRLKRAAADEQVRPDTCKQKKGKFCDANSEKKALELQRSKCHLNKLENGSNSRMQSEDIVTDNVSSTLKVPSDLENGGRFDQRNISLEEKPGQRPRGRPRKDSYFPRTTGHNARTNVDNADMLESRQSTTTPESMQESWVLTRSKASETNLDGFQGSSSDGGTPVCNGDGGSKVFPKVSAGLDANNHTIILDNQVIVYRTPVKGNLEKINHVASEEVSSVLTEAEGHKERKFLRSEPERPPELWVQCDKCRKWRHVPVELDENIKAMAEWTCRDNVDKRFADCNIPQEKSDDEINQGIGYSEMSTFENDIMDGQVDSLVRNSDAIDVQQNNRWTLIKQSIYTHRTRKVQSHDEIMVCACKPPKDGGPGCGDGCLNRELCIECVPDHCPCGDQCSNQRFQKRLYANVEYFRCGKKGFGLRVLEDIPAESFIIEYVGEVLSLQEHEARQKDYAQKGQKHFYFMTISRDEVIDACKKGNFARYINHSCSPNCRTEKWTVNGEVCIGFFAKRDLIKGEEVTFDYQYVRVLGAAAKKCECNSVECRGFIGTGDSEIPSVVVENDSDIEEPDPFIIIDGNQDADMLDSVNQSELVKDRSIKVPKANASDVSRNNLKRVNVKRLNRPKAVLVSSNSNTFSAKGLSCSTNARPEGVEEKLNEMLDSNGGLVRRKEIVKRYLQLLVVTFTLGDASGETSGSTRDLSMVLDALLKTQSTIVLTFILDMNGLQLLDILIKKHSKDFNKTPIIRKLLKILHNLAMKNIITEDLLNSMPKCSGVTSFEESISNLTGHTDHEVQRLARQIQTDWHMLSYGKQFRNGFWHGRNNNPNWKRFPQNGNGFSKFKAPIKSLEAASQVCAEEKTSTSYAQNKNEQTEHKFVEASSEWNSTSNSADFRNENQCSELSGELRRNSSHDQIGDSGKTEQQKSISHSSERSNGNVYHKKGTSRWSNANKHALNSNSCQEKFLHEGGHSTLADPNPPTNSQPSTMVVPPINFQFPTNVAHLPPNSQYAMNNIAPSTSSFQYPANMAQPTPNSQYPINMALPPTLNSQHPVMMPPLPPHCQYPVNMAQSNPPHAMMMVPSTSNSQLPANVVSPAPNSQHSLMMPPPIQNIQHTMNMTPSAMNLQCPMNFTPATSNTQYPMNIGPPMSSTQYVMNMPPSTPNMQHPLIMAQSTSNSQHPIAMAPTASFVGGVPLMPQGNQIGDIGIQDTFSHQMPVAYGIPVEIFQQIHGVPINRSVDNIVPRNQIAPGVPCLLPCEHFSMQPMLNNFDGSVGAGALPHPGSPLPGQPPLPKEPRPLSNACTALTQHHSDQVSLQNEALCTPSESNNPDSVVLQVPKVETRDINCTLSHSKNDDPAVLQVPKTEPNDSQCTPPQSNYHDSALLLVPKREPSDIHCAPLQANNHDSAVLLVPKPEPSVASPSASCALEDPTLVKLASIMDERNTENTSSSTASLNDSNINISRDTRGGSPPCNLSHFVIQGSVINGSCGTNHVDDEKPSLPCIHRVCPAPAKMHVVESNVSHPSENFGGTVGPNDTLESCVKAEACDTIVLEVTSVQDKESTEVG